MQRNDNDPFDYDDEDEGFMTFDAREDEGISRGPIILAVLVLLLVVFGAIMWVYFTSGKSKKEDAPQIVAQSEVYKETPMDQTMPLGEDVDKNIYDATTGNALPPLEVEPANVAEDPLLSANAVAAPTVTKPVASAVVAPRPAASVTVAPKSEPKPAPKPAPKPVVSVPKPKPAVVASKPSEPKAEESVPEKIEVKPSASSNEAKSSGAYAAQLGSFKSRDAADSQLAKYRASGLTGPVSVVSADLGEKGTWYRIRATGFQNRDQAASFCTKAKSSGANCIPTK